MPVLVDSDVLIEVSRGRDSAILEKWYLLSDSDEVVMCSPVSIAELWHGARPIETGILNALFAALLCVPIDHDIGQAAGAYLRRFSRSHALTLGGALIAATAMIQHAKLWTRNHKHYPMKDLGFY